MATAASELVSQAKAQVENLTPGQVVEEIAAGALVVDLREPGELANDRMIADAVHAPRGMLEFWADPSSPYHRPEFDPRRRTVLYCASGGRSALAAVTLAQLEYTDVAHLDGGIHGSRRTAQWSIRETGRGSDRADVDDFAEPHRPPSAHRRATVTTKDARQARHRIRRRPPVNTSSISVTTGRSERQNERSAQPNPLPHAPWSSCAAGLLCRHDGRGGAGREGRAGC